MTQTRPPESNALFNGCLAVAAIAILILLVLTIATGKNGTDQTSSDAAGPRSMAESLADAIGAQPKTVLQPFSASHAVTGRAELQRAVKAEGLAGAMLYSQNCYDRLSRAFSWAKLDECGAGDGAAMHLASRPTTGAKGPEAAYFDSKVAAARYTSAAIAAGAGSETADSRWNQASTPAQKRPATRRRHRKA